MKDDFQHIEDLYRDALTKQEYTPSVSFKTKISLLIVLFQFRKLLFGLLILLGIMVVGYYVFSSQTSNNILQNNKVHNSRYEAFNVLNENNTKSGISKATVFKNNNLVVTEFDIHSDMLEVPNNRLIEVLGDKIEDIVTDDNRSEVNQLTMKRREVINISSSGYAKNLDRKILPIVTDSVMAEKQSVTELSLALDDNSEKIKRFSFSIYASPSIVSTNINTNTGSNLSGVSSPKLCFEIIF
jgi:hypothetical protein